jgi:hypothetical protein
MIMDPSILLKEIRELAYQAAKGTSVRRSERELRWKFQDLDEWLSNGGVFPDQWKS